MVEENPEKKLGFANAVAYYMKLAYNNWHKEIVQDDVIQSELDNITDGQLTFTNTPFVKAFRPQHENRGGGSYGKRGGKFQHRGGGRNDRRDNRNGNFKKKKILTTYPARGFFIFVQHIVSKFFSFI